MKIDFNHDRDVDKEQLEAEISEALGREVKLVQEDFKRTQTIVTESAEEIELIGDAFELKEELTDKERRAVEKKVQEHVPEEREKPLTLEQRIERLEKEIFK